MTITLRLVKATLSMPCPDRRAPPRSVAAAVDALRSANSRLVTVRAQADDLRRVRRDDVADRMESGPVAEAHEALEAAERDVFAAPCDSLEDLAMKILVAAEAEFECFEANEALREEAEAILRASRLG